MKKCSSIDPDAMYQSARWRQASADRLACFPRCRCGDWAVVVAHRDGHQHQNWRVRFWDPRQWQGMCEQCFAAKSARELAE